jgi:hypothetical protein
VVTWGFQPARPRRVPRPGGVGRRPGRRSDQAKHRALRRRAVSGAGLPHPERHGARRRARSSVLVFNGSDGAHPAPGDPMPDHRLGLGDRQDPLGRLATWWKPRLTPVLADHLKGRRSCGTCFPEEHSAAWDPTAVEHQQAHHRAFRQRRGRHRVALEQAVEGGAWCATSSTIRLVDPEGLAEVRPSGRLPAGHRGCVRRSTAPSPTGDTSEWPALLAQWGYR